MDNKSLPNNEKSMGHDKMYCTHTDLPMSGPYSIYKQLYCLEDEANNDCILVAKTRHEPGQSQSLSSN